MSNQIYSAKYSGVDVYEFIHPTGSIMKRKNDGWVNATHILKAANFAKAKRTRILEKEVLKEMHEKVQGGFGKYQGTWVPLNIAINLAEKFDVYQDLKPLFDFSEENGDAAPPPAPKHHHASKASSAKAKKAGRSVSSPAMNDSKTRASTRKANTPSSNDITSDSGAVINPVVTRRRGRPPNSTLTNKRKLGTGLQRSQSEMAFLKPEIPNDLNSNDIANIQQVNSGDLLRNEKIQKNIQLKEIDLDDGLSSDVEVQETDTFQPNHQSSLLGAEGHELRNNDSPLSPSSSSSLPTSPANLNDSNPFDQRLGGGGTSPIISLIPRYSVQSRPQVTDINEKVNDYLTKLVDYFISNEMKSNKTVPQELLHPPTQSAPFIDAPIDPELHTAFHWACSMGNLPIVEALYETGTNIRAANANGQTPLMRSAMFHNSYTRRSFPRIFELLSETVFDIDSMGQTVLHHIVKRKSSTPSAIYYVNVLLSKIKDISPKYRIELLLNTKDANGDTALHIAARNNDREFFDILIKNGSLSTISNNDGQTPTEIMNQHYQDLHLQAQTNIAGSNTSAYTDSFSSFGGKVKGSKLHSISELDDDKNTQNPENTVTNIVSNLHFSSNAAINLVKNIPAFTDSMKHLAEKFDGSYKNHEESCRSTEKMLGSIKRTVHSTDNRIREILETDADADISSAILAQEKDITELKIEAENHLRMLKNQFEHLQKQRLLKLTEYHNGEHNDTDNTLDNKIEICKQISVLQIERKRKISELISHYEDNRKIHKYRRMISEGTEMKTEEVDGCLDIILQTLINNSS